MIWPISSSNRNRFNGDLAGLMSIIIIELLVVYIDGRSVDLENLIKLGLAIPR